MFVSSVARLQAAFDTPGWTSSTSAPTPRGVVSLTLRHALGAGVRMLQTPIASSHAYEVLLDPTDHTHTSGPDMDASGHAFEAEHWHPFGYLHYRTSLPTAAFHIGTFSTHFTTAARLAQEQARTRVMKYILSRFPEACGYWTVGHDTVGFDLQYFVTGCLTNGENPIFFLPQIPELMQIRSDIDAVLPLWDAPYTLHLNCTDSESFGLSLTEKFSVDFGDSAHKRVQVRQSLLRTLP